MDSYFVYVGDGRHVWRFVFYAGYAHDADHAISQAQAEARALGNDVSQSIYMAVPQSAITTRKGAVREASS